MTLALVSDWRSADTTIDRPGTHATGVSSTAPGPSQRGHRGDTILKNQMLTFEDEHAGPGRCEAGEPGLLLGRALRPLDRRDSPLLDIGKPKLVRCRHVLCQDHAKGVTTYQAQKSPRSRFPLLLTVSAYTTFLALRSSRRRAHSNRLETWPSTSTAVVYCTTETPRYAASWMLVGEKGVRESTNWTYSRVSGNEHSATGTAARRHRLIVVREWSHIGRQRVGSCTCQEWVSQSAGWRVSWD